MNYNLTQISSFDTGLKLMDYLLSANVNYLMACSQSNVLLLLVTSISSTEFFFHFDTFASFHITSVIYFSLQSINSITSNYPSYPVRGSNSVSPVDKFGVSLRFL